MVTAAQGNKAFWTRMEKAFKTVRRPVLGRRWPRARWSVQVKSDLGLLAHADPRPPAPAASGVVTKQGLGVWFAQKPML